MKFYNSGKFTHVLGRKAETGEMAEIVKDLKPVGHPVGTCIVNFPGHLLLRVVKVGEWVDLPEDLSVVTVQNACPSLLTEEEAAALAPAKTVKAKE